MKKNVNFKPVFPSFPGSDFTDGKISWYTAFEN